MGVAVALFTRDLRVADNPMLAAAASSADRVIPLFVLDERLLARSSPNRRMVLATALAGLRRSLGHLGGDLVVRHGEAVEVLRVLASQHAITSVHVARDHSRAARHRVAALRERLVGVEVVEHDGHAIVAPGDVRPAGGEHYQVFTPYHRAWQEAPRRSLVPAPLRVNLPSSLDPGVLPTPVALAGGEASPGLPIVDEDEGMLVALDWIVQGIEQYDEVRDDLAEDATSRLSAHLHFGTLSSRWLEAHLDQGRPGERAWSRQLAWRDFNGQLLAARPNLVDVDLRPRDDQWRDDPEEIEAWKQGLTGIPLVDAGMRQLAHEGFMHNRARMVSASFLTKHLYVDWRVGAAHFESLLVDADVANNRASWQWVAGTGMDTRPNRVLNPVIQAERFDPGAGYIRRWVPELRGAPTARDAREPWRLAGTLQALDYPSPIVDLEAARNRFLAVRVH